MIFILNKLFDLTGKNSSFKKYLKENDIYHYDFKCDLVEYNFKDVYKTFNISYFSKNDDLVGNKFADSKYLKDYESIEKSTKNLIVVLIKKFKLKISFKKNDDFSKDIIISDDYNFDPSRLHHKDHIIKIAIIKNDFNNWGNLDEYDYIFTLNEYYDELKKDFNCFKIEGESIYENIKHVLNVLYKRKLEKFHYFLKNVNFEKVFPKERDYFKILNSEYFDDEWYRKTYDLYDNTDSVIHFLLVGGNKGNDPGPNFSTSEYYECNKDVEIAEMNSLLHYELYGKKENRIIHISDIGQRNHSIILNSPYFDGNWYKTIYKLDDDVDAAEHYLDIGFKKGYHPGPDFNTLLYYEANRDVKEVHMNPLLHYELYGRGENRSLLSERRYEEFHSAILNSPYFDGEWYKSTYDIGDMDSLDHYLNIGFVLGYNPGPNFSTKDYYEANEDVEEYGMNPLAHYELYGRTEKRSLSIR